MKIEITEQSIKYAIDGRLCTFAEGDIVSVDDDTATIFLAAGWAKDPSGKLSAGKRKPGAGGPIKPAKLSQSAG